MIVDCFTFFNELDILELRLSVLGDAVDRFVLCEAPFTFRGDPKPLVYAENKARFARWSDRIEHVVYPGPPDANPWNNEWGQRAFLTGAVRDLAPGDLVLIGDVDEIPAPELATRRPEPGRVLAHRHVLSVGYVNRVVVQHWIGTKALARGDLGTRSLNDIRTLPFGDFDVIDSGWHFSALGGAKVMAQKMRSYSHAEADIPYLNDERRLAIQFDSETNARFAPLDGAFPAVLREPRWKPFVWTGPAYAPETAFRLMHVHGLFAGIPPEAQRVAAFARVAPEPWRRAGAERYGTAFAGVFDDVRGVLGALPAGGWVAVDELGACAADELGALAAGGVNAVAYAANARSYTTVRAVVEGAAFPAGSARGVRQMEAALTGSGFRIERRDDVMGSVFAPSVFEQPEPLDAVAGPFAFAGTTREAMHHFSADAYVFRLRSAEG